MCCVCSSILYFLLKFVSEHTQYTLSCKLNSSGSKQMSNKRNIYTSKFDVWKKNWPKDSTILHSYFFFLLSFFFCCWLLLLYYWLTRSFVRLIARLLALAWPNVLCVYREQKESICALLDAMNVCIFIGGSYIWTYI